MIQFSPHAPLFSGAAAPGCRASVIIPARNEEASLAATLDALAAQLDLPRADGTEVPLDWAAFEVLLLVNNCTDRTADAACGWAGAHPGFSLYLAERNFEGADAHVGHARRMLMDTAWARLSAAASHLGHSRGHTSRFPVRAILSTDADTFVAPDWIARNLLAIESGADAVGGVIQLKPGDFDLLPAAAQAAYRRDRRFQRLVAELEDLLDPQPGDPSPRHLEHFGASLGCTPEIYARAGGLPPVNPLEDVAFVDRLRRCDARLRHDPDVIVYTSSRLDGRAEVGLSWQLRTWGSCPEHRVSSAAFILHRFRTLRALRHRFYQPTDSEPLPGCPVSRILQARERSEGIGEFLAEIDCDRVVHESFRGQREGPIEQVNRNLARALQSLRPRAIDADQERGSLPEFQLLTD